MTDFEGYAMPQLEWKTKAWVDGTGWISHHVSPLHTSASKPGRQNDQRINAGRFEAIEKANQIIGELQEFVTRQEAIIENQGEQS